MPRFPSVFIVAAACALTACSHAEPTHSDPDGLVGFVLPQGWQEQSRSNGIRFTHADGGRTVLSITARRREPSRDLAAVRELRQSQIGQQGFEVLIDEMHRVSGWDVWESAAGRTDAGPIMHSFHLLSGELHAEVSLIAAGDSYQNYVADVRTVAESIQPR